MTPMSTATVRRHARAQQGRLQEPGRGLAFDDALLGAGLSRRLLIFVEEEVLIAHVQSSCMSFGRPAPPFPSGYQTPRSISRDCARRMEFFTLRKQTLGHITACECKRACRRNSTPRLAAKLHPHLLGACVDPLVVDVAATRDSRRRTRPPTMVASTFSWFAVCTSALYGCCVGIWCDFDRSTAMMSACLPGSASRRRGPSAAPAPRRASPSSRTAAR